MRSTRKLKGTRVGRILYLAEDVRARPEWAPRPDLHPHVITATRPRSHTLIIEAQYALIPNRRPI